MAKKNAFSPQKGWIEVICGPMFAGKSETLLQRVNRMRYAKIKLLVIKPAADTREKKPKIISRDGRATNAAYVHNAHEIPALVFKSKAEAVIIDEVQFFDNEIVKVCNNLADKGIVVVCAGLDKDFKGEPFGPMPQLLTVAEKVNKLTAICTVCGADATRSQRLINGKPAKYNDPIIKIGNQETYAARCRHHHVVEKR